MELGEAIEEMKRDVRKKVKEAEMRALKKRLAIIVVAIIVFVVSWLIFFKHREEEMTLAQAQLFEKVLPWGYTMDYTPAGVAIIENFWNAMFFSILLAAEFALLAGLILFLLEQKGIIR